MLSRWERILDMAGLLLLLPVRGESGLVCCISDIPYFSQDKGYLCEAIRHHSFYNCSLYGNDDCHE